MANTKNNHVKKINAADKRKRCVDLRKAGFSYQQIGDQVGLSHTQAFRHVKQAINELNAKILESAEEVLVLELERLDRMQIGLWPQAVQGDTRAVQSVLKIMERRARYLGLDLVRGSGEQDGALAAEYVVIAPDVATNAKAWSDLVAQYEVVNEE